jgi:hypothetical protein
MSHFFTTELGRMRTEEAIARADRYRLAQQAQQHKEHKEHKERTSLSRTSRLAYRRALAAVGLSALVAIGTATAALAYPAGPGANAGSGIVADETHPQVKGVRVGMPVESEVSDTFVQAREGTVPDLEGGLPTFAQAREGAEPAIDRALPRRAEHVFDPEGEPLVAGTFVQAREGTPQPMVVAVPSEGERFVASGLYADRAPYVALGSRHNTDALEEMTSEPVAAVPSEGERFIASGLYADRTPYVALGSRHNAEALDQMVDGPRHVADAGVRTPVEDAGISLTTIVAIASLLLLVGGGVMVAARDRDMPKPV